MTETKGGRKLSKADLKTISDLWDSNMEVRAEVDSSGHPIILATKRKLQKPQNVSEQEKKDRLKP